jgi:hypothetical protein
MVLLESTIDIYMSGIIPNSSCVLTCLIFMINLCNVGNYFLILVGNCIVCTSKCIINI